MIVKFKPVALDTFIASLSSPDVDINHVQDVLGKLTDAQLLKVKKTLDVVYYTSPDAKVLDEVYDVITDEVDSRELDQDSVGYRRDADVELPYRLGSLKPLRKLAPAKQADILAQRIVLSAKEDGQSGEIIYKNGRPAKAYTRGNYTHGRDCSDVLKYLKLPDFKWDVRGEFTMDRDVFHKHKGREDDSDYVTSRNMVAGLIQRSKDKEKLRHVKFIAYEILSGPMAGKALSKQLMTLKMAGFDVVPHTVVDGVVAEQVHDLYQRARATGKRDIDGIVVTLDIPYTAGLSYPKHSWKFKVNSLADSVVVDVQDVVWEKSRYGKWKPRIQIAPTIIGGVSVTYLTGHNYAYIQNGYSAKDAGKPPYAPRPINKGATIRAVRSGDVIPYIMEVVKGAAKPSQPPAPFEVRGYDAFSYEGASDVENIKNLDFFFESLGIKGLRQATLKKLYDAGYTTLDDILGLNTHDLEVLGFGPVESKNLHHAIKSARKPYPFDVLGAASGIFGMGMGKGRLKDIITAHPNLMTMPKLPVGRTASERQILENVPKFVQFVNYHKLNIAQPKAASGSKLAGVRVLFTSVRDAELAAYIQEQGGELATTVKNATLLVTKEGASNNKTDLAEELGVPIKTVNAYRKELGL